MAPYYHLLTSVAPAHPLLISHPPHLGSEANTDPAAAAATLQESIVKMEQADKDELEKLDERLKEAEKTGRERDVEGEGQLPDEDW